MKPPVSWCLFFEYHTRGMTMKKILSVVLILIAIVIVLGLAAPGTFVVEKEIVVNKPKDFVFSELKQMKKHQTWNPWSKKDPHIKNTYRGEDGTVGFVAAWEGNDDVGVGEEEIKRIVEGERIDIELRFKKPMEDTSQAYLVTEAVSPQETRIKWGMTGKMSFPGNVICMLMNMRENLGKDFDEGLRTLKANLEK